jgi:hypothetical protein
MQPEWDLIELIKESYDVLPEPPDIRVSSNYKSRLREAATLPCYFIYIRGRFDWSQDTVDDIDWSMYKRIIRSPRSTNPATLGKHLHGIAPSGNSVHRNNSHYAAKCPACACQLETNDHLITCPADSRRDWRRKSRASLIIHVNQTLSLDPQLCDILRDGLARCELDLPPTHYLP